MWIAFQRLPLLISLPGLFFGLMIAPAVYGFWSNETEIGRTFLYAVIWGGACLGVLGLALATTPMATTRYAQLSALVAFFLFLPALLAIPMYEVLPNASFMQAYLDAVGLMTTTGLPVFADTELALTLQIWRGLVGWVAGFFMWVFAWSIFAPMNMGGFEHLAAVRTKTVYSGQHTSLFQITPAMRFWREFVRLAPVYLWITTIAALLMMILGIPPLYAVSRAMGAVATFGFTLDTVGPTPGWNTWITEVIVAVVLVFALSRSLFSKSIFKINQYHFWQDAELRTACALIVFVVVLIPVTLALRGSNIWSVVEFLRNIWAIFFTALSFLTTNGYVAADWVGVQVDLGLGATGIILAGLAIFGGGVATTAGGVKLLRIYVLMDHSRSEIDGLISPSQVTRNIASGMKQHAKMPELAWVFLMVFALVFAALVLVLCVTGLDVGISMNLAVATITNTGPLIATSGAPHDLLQNLPDTSKAILILSMVFGRLEVLAFLALFNPNIFR